MAVLSIQRSLLSITIALSLFNFANGLVGVFVPLIMLENGAEFWQVAAFYLTYAVAKLCFNYPTIRITQKYGPHASLGMGFIAGTIQFMFLWMFTSTHHLWLAYLAAIALALTNAAIWNSLHIHVSKVMSNATKSSSLATMEVINQVLGAVAPLLGGVIGLVFGPAWLLIGATLFALSALIPLRSIGSMHAPEEDVRPVTYRITHAPLRDVFANFCFNIETAVGLMVWPIFLAVEVRTYGSIGVISALSAAVTVVVVLIAGHRGDKGRDRQVMREGIAISSLVDFARLLPLGTVGITVVGVAYRASLAYMNNPWTSTYYHHTKRKGIPYVVSMEIACDFAYLMLWTVLLLVTAFASIHKMFVVAFVLAGIAAWGCLFISKQGEFESTSVDH